VATIYPEEGRRHLWAVMSSFHKVKLAFLAAAFLSFILSVSLWFLVDREIGLFVGLWVPAIHSLGTLVLVGEETRS